MKITDIQVIPFLLPTRGRATAWGYEEQAGEREGIQTITKVLTDDGAEGFATGGVHSFIYGATREEVEQLVKPLLVGENPLDRERLWQWMEGHHGLSERLIGNIDTALWDLAGRVAGMPVAKMLGGAREKVKAYASTAPNLGPPETYAQQARDCRERGYQAYKVHAYIHADPKTLEPTPGKPASPAADIEVCEAVRDAVGDSMTLMHDPWGVYTYNEAVYVGRELERLGFYFFEHPMDERRIEPYRRLSAELDIPVCGPELVAGFHYSRAEWVLQKATDIGRFDINSGGLTACRKVIDMYESFGVPCELEMGGFGIAAILGATTAETCEFFERGLLFPLDHPLGDHDRTPPYLNAPCDPMDTDGYVNLPQGPGLGFDFNWDYIHDNLVKD